MVTTLYFINYTKSYIKFFAFIAYFLAYIFCGSSVAFADTISALPLETQNSEDKWKLTADLVTTLDNGAIIEAHGDVVLQRGNDILKAEFIRYYESTDWAFVRENVYVKLGKDELFAEEAEFDLVTSTGFLKNGNVFMEGPHVYFEGEHINKYLGDRYSFVNAEITSCDPENPAWALKASSATVEIDGYATLSRPNFVIADVDLPPVPFLVLPVKTTRQSGLLLPDYGTSTLHGIFYTQPYFWVIDDERDATFYASFMEESGIMLSGEYRSHTRLNSKTLLAADYLFSTSQDYEDNRYWLRGMSDGKIYNTSWKYKINIDYVSDPTFLLDYDYSLTGHENSNNDFFSFFGRELASINRNRVTEGYIYNRWGEVEATLGFEYIQDPDYGTNFDRDTDPTVQKLPELGLYVYPLASASFPLQFDASLQGSYNYRRYGSSGMKTEFKPRVSIPYEFGFISTLTQMGLNQRNYFMGTSSASSAPLETEGDIHENASDTLFDMKFQASTQFAKVWDFGFDKSESENSPSQIVALRHTIEPRLSYSYLESNDQEHLPYYSIDDRILPENEINLSFRNIFTTKMQRLTLNKETNEESSSSSFRNIAYVDINFGYDFKEASRKENLEFERRPFKDISVDAQINAFGLGLDSQLSYSLYGDGITRFDIGTRIPLFALEKYLTWDIDYSYRHEMYNYQEILRYSTSNNISLSSEANLIRNTFTFRPASFLDLRVEHYTNLKTHDSYEWDVSANFKHQCYVFSVNYIKNQVEERYSVSVILPGIFE